VDENGESMRVLIVGAGVAGLTLAAKLAQQGRTPVVVEEAPELGRVGYSLGLYPLGSTVLHGLGKYDELLERGCPAATYQIFDGGGELLQDVDLTTFTDEIGPMVLISRADLIDMLVDAATGADLRMGQTVTQVSQEDGRHVAVELSDGSTDRFDLVVGCDGMHSKIRDTVVGGTPDVFDSGWVLWTWWADLDDWPKDVDREYWGNGRGMFVYPTATQVMFCAGMHRKHLTVDPGDVDAARAFLSREFEELAASDPLIARGVAQANDLFPWPMTDVRAAKWANGRVGLCGDAAVGFLPTAGAGANSAMHSASSLADELSRVNGDIAPLALELYEKRCRSVVEKNQSDSRKLARLIFVDGSITTWGRDEIMKHYPMSKMVKEIVDAMHTPW
jgi:2-polyprenyl-6-methoxyphenol hydroxylase-like FAD-dependent oxidoreductase